MDITILGATGQVGRRIVNEAILRGHNVIAVSRSNATPPPVHTTTAQLDINDTEALIVAAQKSDFIISAIRPNTGDETRLATLTQSALNAASHLNIPILIVGGAARLKLSAQGNNTVLSTPNFLPESVIPIAKACQSQFEICTASTHAKWIYLSPPAMLLAGEKTGRYRIGSDTLVTDAAGKSTISIEDFAVAILDEVEGPSHIHNPFTVAY